MALSDLIGELKSSASDAFLPFVRGVGSGASMGLHKYPAAAGMVLLNQLLEKNPQLTMSEALQLINEQQQTDRQNNPVASYGGEIAGSIVPGVGMVGKAANAVARGTTSVLAPVATATAMGAGQGAVSAFNERQNLDDAPMGAGLGALGGLAGGSLQTVANKVGRWAGTSAQKKAADQSYEAANKATKKMAAHEERARELIETRQNLVLEKLAQKGDVSVDFLRNAVKTDPEMAAGVAQKVAEGVKKDRLIQKELNLHRRAQASYRANLGNESRAREFLTFANDRANPDALVLERMAETGRTPVKTLIDNVVSPRAMGGPVPLGMLGGGALGGIYDLYRGGNGWSGALTGSLTGGAIMAKPALISAAAGTTRATGATMPLAEAGRLALPTFTAGAGEGPDEFEEYLRKPAQAEADEFEQYRRR